MVAPVAKGIIVATTLLLAAGLAAYENEQIRAWIEVQRRKIAIVLNGESASSSHSEKDEQERERKAEEIALQLRDEVIKRHRDEIFERARKEGVAVDWDELAAVEKIYEEQNKKAAADAASSGVTKRRSAQSFDELVGSDGMLRDRDISSGFASGVAGSSSGETIRQRGATGFGRGSAFANPFDDEAQLLFDQELIGAGGEELAGISRAGNTSNAISAEEDLQSLVDVHEFPYKTDMELEDEINEAIRRSLEDSSISPHGDAKEHDEQPLITVGDDTPISEETSRSHTLEPETSHPATFDPQSLQNSIYQSYYYNGQAPSASSTSSTFLSATASPSASHTLGHPTPTTYDEPQEDSDDALTPAGTLTPTTEAGFSIDGESDADDSLYGEPSALYQSFNVGDMLDSRLRDEEQRRRTQAQAHEDDAESSDGFSVVDGDGTHTPGSWTDVESVGGFDEEEREGSASTVR